MDKGDIRKEILGYRLQISKEPLISLSSQITSVIMSLDIFRKSSSIALYAPFRNEVDVLSAINSKKDFFFPKVVKGSKKLNFYHITNLGQLKSGSYGILEPDSSLHRTDIENIDLFFVPGVAFSKTGERLGYGGGYYDCTLKFAKKDAFKIGVGFELQIVDSGFSYDHDIKMDLVVTEKNIYDCNHLI